jgi:hypothetical protein
MIEYTRKRLPASLGFKICKYMFTELVDKLIKTQVDLKKQHAKVNLSRNGSFLNQRCLEYRHEY